MYVCICNAITEKQIRQAVDGGVTDLWGLEAALGVAGTCGSCRETAAEILAENRAAARSFEPKVYVPSIA